MTRYCCCFTLAKFLFIFALEHKQTGICQFCLCSPLLHLKVYRICAGDIQYTECLFLFPLLQVFFFVCLFVVVFSSN